jgi:ribose-phosphate pyrophosphokinase
MKIRFGARIIDARQWPCAGNCYQSCMLVFALKGSERLGASVAGALKVDLAAHEERDFGGGEHKARPLVSVRGKSVYVIHSLQAEEGASVNDKLCRLLFFLAACRENGAAEVTAICPYLAYSRKDRQTKARDPVTMRYVAALFEAMGTDRFVTLDVHNLAAFQNAFRCRTLHLSARPVFCDAIAETAGGAPVTVFSPDGGGMKRAQLVREMLASRCGIDAGFGFMEKRRSRGVVSGELFAGDVAGQTVVIVDDMIGSGGTMLRAAEACRERGAKAVHAIATHGLFGKGAEALFESPVLDGILVTDSVSSADEAAVRHSGAKLRILPAGPTIGEAIRRLETGEALSDFLGMED